METIDLLMGVITNPTNTFDKISERQPIHSALLVNVLLLMLSFFSTKAASPELYQGVIDNIFSFLMSIIMGLIIFVLSVLILFGLSRLLKGSANFWQLFCVLSFANIITIFTPIQAALSNYLGSFHPLSILIGIFLGIWGIYLYLLAIKQANQFSWGKTILLILLSILVIFVITFLIFLLLIFGLGLTAI